MIVNCLKNFKNRLNKASISRISNLTDHQNKLMQRNLPKQKKINGVKHIICVASGKGCMLFN